MTLLALTAAASEAAEKAAETVTDTALIEGAILLGVATLFVLIFRRLGLGAVLLQALAEVREGVGRELSQTRKGSAAARAYLGTAGA